MEGGSEVDPSPLLSLVAACSYGVASMAMVFINKAVLMQYAYSITLLTLQQLATALLIHFGRVTGYTKFKDINMATAKKLLPVSIFYNANVAFALASLKGVNIPMYIALKRLTPLAVLVAGIFFGKGRPPLQESSFKSNCAHSSHQRLYTHKEVPVPSPVLRFIPRLKNTTHLVSLAVVFTAVGCIIAGIGDFSFDLFGYSMALTSVLFQTMYLVLVEKSGAEDGLSSVELMFYNSLLSLPCLFFLIIATGEFPYSLSLLFAKAYSSTFFIILILSLVMGIILNYTMFLCTIVNSALTTTIVGVLKGVGSTTLGFVLLGGVEVHALNVTGLVINTTGGLWYSYAKYQQKRTSRKVISDEEAHQKKDYPPNQ